MKKKELQALVASGISRWRKQLGLTMEQLAEASGVDANYLAHVAVGSKTPSLDILAKVLHGLGIGPEELFRGAPSGAVGPKDDLDRKIQAQLRGLKPGQKADVLAILAKLRRPEALKALRLVVGA